MREHLGVLFVKGGYTTKKGTLVCLVLYKVAILDTSGLHCSVAEVCHEMLCGSRHNMSRF